MATEAARDKPYSPCESARGMGNEASNRRLNRYGGGKEPGVTRIYDAKIQAARRAHQQEAMERIEEETKAGAVVDTTA